ncbi:chromosome segregation ATPase [Bradyrhizobium sp. S3.3.6]
MGDSPRKLPEDIEALQAALLATRAELANVRAQQSDDQALIAHLKLQIEKLNRDRYGPRSERTARLLDQLELTLEELEASATEDELAAEMSAAKTTKVASFTRKRPSRQPLPEHLPRERVIVGKRENRLTCRWIIKTENSERCHSVAQIANALWSANFF